MVVARVTTGLLFMTALSTLLSFSAVAAADESAGQPLEFRRLYVPQDRVGEVIRDEKYVPYKSDEFERLVNELSSSTGERPPPVLATMATYEARFDGQSLVDGKAVLNLRLVSDQIATYSLNECNLAIAKPAWVGRPTQEVRIGTTNQGDRVLFVDQTDAISFDWSARGTADSSGDVVLSLQFPRAASSQLNLRIPAEWTPNSPNAAISRLESGDLPESRLWRLVVDGTSRVKVRMTRAAQSGRGPVVIVKHKDLTYSFDKTVVRLLAVLKFDVERRPLRQMSFRVAAPMRMRMVRLGDNELSFVTSRGSAGETTVTVAFPEPVYGIDRKLIVDAVTPPILESPWQLPSVLVEDALWQEGSTSLEFVAPIALERLELHDCVQTAVRPLLEPAGKIVDLQQLSADASVTIVLGGKPNRASYVGGTEISLLEDELRASCILDVTCSAGTLFEMQMEVAKPWVVDSMQAVIPASANSLAGGQQAKQVPLEWEVRSASSGQQVVAVQLSSPIRRGRVVRIEMRALRPRPRSSTAISMKEMQVVTPLDVKREQHLIALYGNSPHRFELRGENEITWFDPSKANKQQREVLPFESGGFFFESDARSTETYAFLSQSASRFQAQIEVSASVMRHSLDETLRLRCEPSNLIQQVQVALNHAGEEQIRWSLEGGGERGVTARRLPPPQRAGDVESSDGPASIDVWEITLNRPRDVPFTVIGRRHSKSIGNVTASLAWMPEATSQEGTLTLGSGDGTQFEVEQEGLQPFPLPLTALNEFSGNRAVYRYRPVDLPVVLIKRRLEENSTVAAWAWSCRLQSRIGEGRSLHSAFYQIENVGLNRITLKLPDNAELRQVVIDGRAINVSSSDNDSQVEFALPPGVRYPAVTVNFTDHQGVPGIAGTCTAPVPEISIPVLRTYWTVWVPPEIRCDKSDHNKASLTPKELGKRLLGPLLSDSKRAPFVPADLVSTWNSIAGHGAEDTVASARRVFAAFSAIQKDSATWSQLVQNYDVLAQQQGDDSPLPQLFVNTLSLQRLAISPTGKVPSSDSGRFDDVLGQAGLALLFSEGRVALVSQDWLSARRALIRPLASPLAWTAGENAELLDNLSLVPANEWLESAARSPVLWSPRDHSGDSELFSAGWTATEFEFDPGDNIEVQMVRPSRINVLSWSAFYLAIGVAWWLTVKKPRLLFLAVLFIGTAATFSFAHYSMIATACLLGLVVGAVVGIVSGRVILTHAKRRTPLALENGLSRVSAISTALILFASCFYFLLVGSSFADDAVERGPSQHRKIYSVVIPIDKEKRPVGDTVYLPQELFESLSKLTTKRNAASQSWLLQAAEYDVVLNWRGVATELGATELIAKYHLDVNSNRTEVLLPLSRDQLHIIPDRAMLNGKPIQVDWAADGSGLLLDVGDVGSHHLELPFRPVTSANEQLVSMSVSIPRVHRGILRVHLPEQAEGISIPNSLGSIVREDDSRTLTAQTGPVDRLALHWQRSGVDDRKLNRMAASQISWLTVGRGSVVMRSKFRFTAKEGLVDQVAIKTDPRLQLRLPPDQPIEIVKESNIDQGATRLITFRPTGPSGKELTLDATFSVPGSSGVGNIQLPRVEAVADESVNRWLAISAGPGLLLTEPSPEGTEPISTDSFLDQWGSRKPDQAPPSAAALLKESAIPVQFKVCPAPLAARAAETLQVALGRDSATVQYQAQIAVSAGKVFTVRLRVPGQLRVSEITLHSDGDPLAAAWKRTVGDTITIDASQPLPNRSTLLLRGEVSLPRKNIVTLPNVTADSIPVGQRQIEVLRRSSVRLQVQLGKQWRNVASDRVGTFVPTLGRLVAILEPSTTDSPGGVRLPRVNTRNDDPRPSYQLGTAAQRIDGEWWAVILCRLHDFKGEVDTLRLDVPSSWDSPVESENGDVVRVTTPGSDRSQLLVRPTKPLFDGSVVRLRGRLLGSPKELPDIDVTDREVNERFVALQVESANQKTEWQRDGLREAPWPSALAEEIDLSDGQYVTYRAVQRYRARVGNMGTIAGIPQVGLFDVRLDHFNKSYSCVASFDIEPAGMKECVFQLPAKTRLLYVSVAGQPVLSSAKSDNQWSVQLSHEQLPQRIEMLFTGKWPVDRYDAETPPSLSLPQVLGVPVERTLVTLTSDGHESRWGLQGTDVTPLRQDLYRLRRMTRLIELSRTIARDQIPEDRRRWYVPWAQCMVASTRNVTAYNDNSLETELSEITNTQLEAAQDLQTAGSLNEELKSTVVRADLVGTENASGVSFAGASRIFAQGKLREVGLDLRSSSRQPVWQRLAAIACFPLVCVVLYLLCTRGPFGEWIIQWFFVFGVLIGIFWWLCLTPSIVGWLFVVVSVLGALRSHGSSVTGARRRGHAV